MRTFLKILLKKFLPEHSRQQSVRNCKLRRMWTVNLHRKKLKEILFKIRNGLFEGSMTIPGRGGERWRLYHVPVPAKRRLDITTSLLSQCLHQFYFEWFWKKLESKMSILRHKLFRWKEKQKTPKTEWPELVGKVAYLYFKFLIFTGDHGNRKRSKVCTS